MNYIFKTVNENNSWSESYDRVRPAIEAVPVEKLLTVNLDVVAATTTALGALPAILEQRLAIAEKIRGFDFENFERLGDLARAASFAHSRLNTSAIHPDEIRDLADVLAEKRELLLGDVKGFIRRGLLSESILRDLTGTVGYQNVIHDLGFLVILLQDNWAIVEGKSLITLDEIKEAGDLVSHMQAMLGARKLAQASAPENIRLRDQAYTLFVTTYDAARRAILYVRGDEEGERIAPSLYKARMTSRRAPEVEEAHEMTLVPPEAAVPNAASSLVVSTPKVTTALAVPSGPARPSLPGNSGNGGNPFAV